MTAQRLTPRQVWTNHRFRVFAAVYGIDVAAETLWLVTLGWLASSAPTPLLTGLILCTGALPGLVLTATGGLLTDRHGPAALAVATLILRLVVYLPWALAFHSSSLVVAAVLAFLLGGVSALHDPAIATYPLALLPREGQESAATIERIIGRAAQAVGAASGGYLIGLSGIPAPGIVATVLTLAALLVLARLRPQSRGPGVDGESIADETEAPRDTGRWMDGYRYVRLHPVLRHTVLIQGSVNLATSAALTALLPLMARQHHWSATGYGTALACYGVGMLLGLFVALRLTHRSTRARLTIAAVGALASCVLVAVLALTTVAAFAAMTAAAMGLALGPVGPILSGYARAVAAEVLAGRVMAVIITVTFVIEPVGWLVLTALADATTLAVAGVVFGLVAAGVVAFTGTRFQLSHPSLL